MWRCFFLLSIVGLIEVRSFAGTRATAVATVVDGSIVSIAVTFGGSGYRTAPGVSFSGGVGEGATATATLSGDRVERITMGLAGTGYDSGVMVWVEPPPEELRLEVEAGPKIKVIGDVGIWHQLEWSPKLGPDAVWQSLEEFLMTTNGVVFVPEIPAAATRFYRATEARPPVGPAGFVWIAAGAFEMGSPPEEADRDSDEGQHRVRITSGFWMSDHETTQEEYEAVMERNPSYFEGSAHPVETVTWADATEYCQRLTAKEGGAGKFGVGWGYRLPTEAEWEYSYRAGTISAIPGEADAIAWTSSNSDNQTHEVRTKVANPWGLYDMGGNVWEWCSDWYGEYPVVEATNPQGSFEGSWRVVRGGSWFFDEADCRAAYRRCFVPGFRFYALGFRPVLGRIP